MNAGNARSSNGATASSSSPSTAAQRHDDPRSGSGNALNASGSRANGARPSGPSVVRRPPVGGIKVTTVKRAVGPAVQSAHARAADGTSSSSKVASSARFNALPEETRLRIEEARRERERKQAEEGAAARAAAGKARSSKPGSSSKSAQSSRQGTPKKKRKAHVSDSEGDDDDDLFGPSASSPAPRRRKGVSREQSDSAAASSSIYKKLGRFGVESVYNVPRDVFDEAAFELSGDASGETNAISSAEIVRGSGKTYGHFFHGLEDDGSIYLEYPAQGAREQYLLLVPKERDEHDPISDLLSTVRCIVENYLTPEQQRLFGSVEDVETRSAAGNIITNGNTLSTPLGRVSATPPLTSSAGSREATPLTSGASVEETTTPKLPPTTDQSPARSAILAHAKESASAAAFGNSEASLSQHDSPFTDSILRSLTKARNRRDGPLFVRTVERFNETLRALKDEGKIRDNVRAMSSTGISRNIWEHIHNQSYARTVGPSSETLNKYEAFSDNVYGELLPRFMSEIAQLTRLGPESVFVDLGSGVGNLLVQVALQTGSQAYGCEMMPNPARLAKAQVIEAERRWKMWGLRGAHAEAWEGDFGESAEVRDVLRRADVVLVNNYAFTAATNDKLSWLFLDLKDGANIVSLKPFVPPDFRVTERTMSSPLAILKVTQRAYTTGCVSWAESGGSYYIHTVDRSLLAKLDSSSHVNGSEGAS